MKGCNRGGFPTYLGASCYAVLQQNPERHIWTAQDDFDPWEIGFYQDASTAWKCVDALIASPSPLLSEETATLKDRMAENEKIPEGQGI